MQARTDENGKHGFLNKLPTGMSFIPTTNCSSEASAPSTHTQSTSSTVISPSSFDVSDPPCESSAQSGSTSSLKEQDYIGMAVMYSSFLKEKQSLRQLKLDLEEPDLRLGLGPSPAKGVCADNVGFHLFPQLNRKEGPCLSHTQIDAPVSTNVAEDIAPTHPHSSRTYPDAGSLKRESTYAQIDAPASMSVILDVAHAHPHSSGSYPVPSSLKRVDAMPFQSAFLPPTAADPHFKSSKRLFSDTKSPSTPNVGSPVYVKPEEMKTSAMFATGALRMIMPRPDVNSKSQSQNLYWGNPRSSSWQSESQNLSSLGQLPRKHSDNSLLMKSSLERPLSASGSALASNRESISDEDEAPPSKEQVVGWPPVRSYRRSAINSGRSRPAGTESDGQAAIFVKVNMDGIPIGRKVDLNTYRNYDELLSALEGMFYSPPVGEGVRFLHARDFVLTYEDKEGDWMLVGDVPWGMFVNTVKRLRITRGSDSACLGSSTSKNFT